jgi:hypothetical protein
MSSTHTRMRKALTGAALLTAATTAFATVGLAESSGGPDFQHVPNANQKAVG